MVASKFLQDRTYSNRAWARISGLCASELENLERIFLRTIQFNLVVDPDQWQWWIGDALPAQIARHAADTKDAQPMVLRRAASENVLGQALPFDANLAQRNQMNRLSRHESLDTTSLGHSFQVAIHKQWWLIILPIGTFAEAAGYVMRIYGNHDPFLRDPYVAMMCLLIITPCLFAAVHFATLGRIMTLFPARFSPFKPVIITPFFVTIDVASLVIQGIGAGMSGTAESADDAHSGSMIVVGGVALQLAGYLVFDALFVYFYLHVHKENHPLVERYRPLMVGIFSSSMLIVLRSIYRVIEMAVGWDGVINSTEWPLYVFDSTFVWLAVVALNIFHPGAYLPKKFSWKVLPQTDEEAYKLNGFDPNGRPEKWACEIRDEENVPNDEAPQAIQDK
ncbi:hypothetical protein MCUN1_003178 [Malassezia cuniculi]|uniref:Uncharacterized protein n=1 Tax=Malassezia cuniculi TaxID=948313 RepID=A0AAF0J812_9BASI|nr:hypothetical protein MCUN1_003178 [Malassezia cuniculi]